MIVVLWWPWLLAAGVAVVDLATGAWARAVLAPPGTTMGGVLRFRMVHNRGLSLGMGEGHPVLVTVVAVLALLALSLWLLRAHGLLTRLGLALAVGGGVGNLIDRLAHGYVTDWIHVAGYPATFNLADVAIRAGLLVALISLLLRPRSARSGAEPRSRPH